MNRLIFRSLISGFVLFALFCLPSIASADGVTVLWTLSGVTFNDGSRRPDRSTITHLRERSTYSAIDITTTANEYTSLAPGGSSSTGMALGSNGADLTNTRYLMILFNGTGLTNSGGTDPLFTGFPGVEVVCTNADCSDASDFRFITGGEVLGTVSQPQNRHRFRSLAWGYLFAGGCCVPQTFVRLIPPLDSRWRIRPLFR